MCDSQWAGEYFLGNFHMGNITVKQRTVEKHNFAEILKGATKSFQITKIRAHEENCTLSSQMLKNSRNIVGQMIISINCCDFLDWWFYCELQSSIQFYSNKCEICLETEMMS